MMNEGPPGRGTIRRLLPILLGAAFLLAVHISTFFSHYFQYDAPPWDFQFTYYYFRYYWITAMQAGVFPEWAPFQAAGYAFPVNPQTSLSYPPEWLFVLFNKPFTMHAATVLQCWHIFFAAVGAFVLARLLGFARLQSLVLACGFHFFGLFFSNASHVDTIKANVMIPWLAASMIAASSANGRLRFAAYLALPVICYFLITGGYIGTVISAFVVAGLVLFGLLLRALKRRGSLLPIAKIAGLLMVGILLAANYVLPIVMLKNQFIRSADFSTFEKSFFDFKQSFTFFLPYVYYPFHLPSQYIANNVSHRPVFITAPLFFSIFLIQPTRIRRYLPYFAVAGISLVFMTDNPIFSWIGHMFPVLYFSRQPITDYKIFLSLPVAFLGLSCMRDYLSVTESWWRFSLRVACITGWIVLGCHLLVWRESVRTPVFLWTFLGSQALFLLFVFCIKLRWIPNTTMAWLVFCLLVTFDGMQYHFNQRIPWASEPNMAVYWLPVTGGRPTRNYPLWRAELTSALTEPLRQRPARLDTYPQFLGYREGMYAIEDYAGGARFVNYDRAMNSPRLKEFLMLPGGAAQLAQAAAETLDDKATDLPKLVLSPRIISRHYSSTKVEYDVDLDRDSIVMENEMNFPGWSATLSGRAGTFQAQLEPLFGQFAADLAITCWKILDVCGVSLALAEDRGSRFPCHVGRFAAGLDALGVAERCEAGLRAVLRATPRRLGSG